jgi:hypothetical protein
MERPVVVAPGSGQAAPWKASVVSTAVWVVVGAVVVVGSWVVDDAVVVVVVVDAVVVVEVLVVDTAARAAVVVDRPVVAGGALAVVLDAAVVVVGAVTATLGMSTSDTLGGGATAWTVELVGRGGWVPTGIAVTGTAVVVDRGPTETTWPVGRLGAVVSTTDCQATTMLAATTAKQATNANGRQLTASSPLHVRRPRR